MNKIYTKIVVYNPSENRVSRIKMLPYEIAVDKKASDEAFFDVFERSNHIEEIIIGITLGKNFYQLSPAPYGTYVRENATTMASIHKGRLLTAISKFHEDHHIPFEIY